MEGTVELLLTSCSNDTNASVNLWNFRTGTHLNAYRADGTCTPHGLQAVEGFVIGGQQNKPFLNVWAMNKQHKEQVRLIAPGKILTFAASPDLSYIAVGVNETCRLYQATTGRLVGVALAHFQPIRVIKFSYNGTRIGCGGDDGIVTIWNVVNIGLSGTSKKPEFTFSSHSLPVTDLVFSTGHAQSYAISVSSDRTVQIHDLGDGRTILTIVFDTPLTAVCLLSTEVDVFVGDLKGDIHKVSLHSPPRTAEYHLSTSNSGQEAFLTGHSKAITSLSCSIECDILISGSSDETVKIWHIESKQCLRTLQLKGPVTNVLCFIPPMGILTHDFMPRGYLKDFQKNFVDLTDENLTVCILPRDGYASPLCGIKRLGSISGFTESDDSDRVRHLDKINHDLFKVSVAKLLLPNKPRQRKRALLDLADVPNVTFDTATETEVAFSRKKALRELKTKKKTTKKKTIHIFDESKLGM